MSQFDEVFSSSEWAFAFAEALERQLGDERILTVGSARDTVAELLAGTTRAVALEFSAVGGETGVVTLLAGQALGAALEHAASDETLLTACAGALDVAVRTIGERSGVDIDPDAAVETDAERALDDAAGRRVIYPLLDGGDLLGCVTLHVRPAPSAANGPSAAVTGDAPGSRSSTPVNGASESETGSGNPLGASYVLADVEMGVTAELGRCRMTVRELLSITPGAVIDLDRARARRSTCW
ncbi:MAG: flagellar motor switch protein FliN [Actinomycetota bacterium]|nr:flagellar motor switch protein FliN [Actinomycetota bacterium]